MSHVRDLWRFMKDISASHNNQLSEILKKKTPVKYLDCGKIKTKTHFLLFDISEEWPAVRKKQTSPESFKKIGWIPCLIWMQAFILHSSINLEQEPFQYITISDIKAKPLCNIMLLTESFTFMQRYVAKRLRLKYRTKGHLRGIY